MKKAKDSMQNEIMSSADQLYQQAQELINEINVKRKNDTSLLAGIFIYLVFRDLHNDTFLCSYILNSCQTFIQLYSLLIIVVIRYQETRPL